MALVRSLVAGLALTGFVSAQPHGHAPEPRTDDDCNETSSTVNSTTTSTRGKFTYDELWDLNQAFWTSFIAPNNHKQATSINSSFFAPDIIGNIDATRLFPGQELNTEYIYGLFDQIALNPGTFAVIGVPQNFTVTQFLAQDYMIATTVLVNFYFNLVDKHYPVEIGVWYTWSDKKQIMTYDATFLRYLDWQFADLFAVAEQKLNVSNQTAFSNLVQEELANSICTTEKKYCNGTNQQYPDQQTCQAFLTNGSVPLGSPYQLGMDTVVCRSIHQAMLPYRPDVHCPHVGPTGGGYCTNDRTYTQFLDTNPFTADNAPFILPGKPAWNGSTYGQR